MLLRRILMRQTFKVFDNRNELYEENGVTDSSPVVAAAGVCVSPYHYRSLLVALCVLLSLLLAMLTAALYIYRQGFNKKATKKIELRKLNHSHINSNCQGLQIVGCSASSIKR